MNAGFLRIITSINARYPQFCFPQLRGTSPRTPFKMIIFIANFQPARLQDLYKKSSNYDLPTFSKVSVFFRQPSYLASAAALQMGKSSPSKSRSFCGSAVRKPAARAFPAAGVSTTFQPTKPRDSMLNYQLPKLHALSKACKFLVYGICANGKA